MYAHDFSVCASIDYIFLPTCFAVYIFSRSLSPPCSSNFRRLELLTQVLSFVHYKLEYLICAELRLPPRGLLIVNRSCHPCRRETSPEGGADRSPRAPSCYVTSRSDQIGENSFQRRVDSNVLKIPIGISHQEDKGKTTKYTSKVCIHIYIWTDTLHTVFLLESQYLGHENIKCNTCIKAT